ncbi:MAG: glycoside hydrolase family 15 protein [Smithella sp.]
MRSLSHRACHFVYSKASCWSAVDRAIEIAETQSLSAPTDAWKETRGKIRESIETRGYDQKKGVFIQAFENHVTDSALLLLPSTGFVDYLDERFIRTTNAIQRELTKDGLLLRYHHEDDPLKIEEGCFLACSFWLATCLARQHRFNECHAVLSKVLSTGNDLGLFSEEYDTTNQEMLGNFPQALSHLAFIDAAIALAQSEER